MTDHAISAQDVSEVPHRIPTEPNYNTRLRIFSAVGNTLPQAEAEAVLLAWSPDKAPGENHRKLRHRLGKVRVGSLVETARSHAPYQGAPVLCERGYEADWRREPL
jgi:hypothetical protein